MGNNKKYGYENFYEFFCKKILDAEGEMYNYENNGIPSVEEHDTYDSIVNELKYLRNLKTEFEKKFGSRYDKFYSFFIQRIDTLNMMRRLYRSILFKFMDSKVLFRDVDIQLEILNYIKNEFEELHVEEFYGENY